METNPREDAKDVTGAAAAVVGSREPEELIAAMDRSFSVPPTGSWSCGTPTASTQTPSLGMIHRSHSPPGVYTDAGVKWAS